MTYQQLIAHPANPAPPVDSLRVSLVPAGEGGVTVQFDCRCPTDRLRLPQARPPEAADELWRHTCCELFVAVAGSPAYREFNCSPSGQWAAYAFSAYRVRDPAMLNPVPPPAISFAADAASWTLRARLDAALLPRAEHGQLEFGAATVLEDAEGNLSYWAPRHAAAAPDFHRRETFVLQMSELY